MALSLSTLVQAPAAVTSLQLHPPIFIASNLNFTAQNGVTGGNGTAANPYTIQGWDIDASTSNAIEIHNTTASFIIQNITIHSTSRVHEGIVLIHLANGQIQNSTITNNDIAIQLSFTNNILIANNTISDNLEGISLGFSTNVTVSHNNFTLNGVFIFGAVVAHLDTHTITQDNTVNGKPLYYYKDCKNLDINGVQLGQLIIANCRNVRVSNLQISGTEFGLQMTYVNDTLIANNNVSSNAIAGITLYYCTKFNVTSNRIYGNLHGLIVFSSTLITAYHNNFINNGFQATDDRGPENHWDNGYPSGGNYWSNYSGLDQCSGPSQNTCTGPDGIIDTPYSIDSNSVDRYPLKTPFAFVRDIAVTSLTASPTSVIKGGVVSVVVGVKNLGVVPETFTVTANYNGTAIASQTVTNLLERMSQTLPFAWNTTQVPPGAYTMSAQASILPGENNTLNNALANGTVTVRPEMPPTLDPINPKTVDEETIITFTATARDPNGYNLTFSLGNNTPAGASITPAGVFSWTPTEAQGPRTYQVTIIVTDSKGLTSSEEVTIQVNEVNIPPTLEQMGNETVQAGTSLTFTVKASDPDIPAETLTFSLSQSPSGTFPDGAKITPDGVFSWTPNTTQGPGTYVVTITVSDGKSSTSEDVTITVSGNQKTSSHPPWEAWPWVALGILVPGSSLLIWFLRLRRGRRLRGSQLARQRP